MEWNHKGVNISLVGSRFVAEIDKQRLIASSLDGVKKKIDKLKTKEAKAIPLNMPVVILREKDCRFGRPTQMRIDKAVITELDPVSYKLLGLDAPDGWKNGEILPDTPKNAELLKAHWETEQLERSQNADISDRKLHFWFGHGRNMTRNYADAVDQVKNGYAEAAKESKKPLRTKPPVY